MDASSHSAPHSSQDHLPVVTRSLENYFRYALAVIFIWFGALKIAGVSPAEELVIRTFFFLPPKLVVPFLGYWELLVGLCFVFQRFLRLALVLMALQIPGTFLSLIVVPQMCFVRAPFLLTTNGEFIVKNLLLIGAGFLLAKCLPRPPRDKLARG